MSPVEIVPEVHASKAKFPIFNWRTEFNWMVLDLPRVTMMWSPHVQVAPSPKWATVSESKILSQLASTPSLSLQPGAEINERANFEPLSVK